LQTALVYTEQKDENSEHFLIQPGRHFIMNII